MSDTKNNPESVKPSATSAMTVTSLRVCEATSTVDGKSFQKHFVVLRFKEVYKRFTEVSNGDFEEIETHEFSMPLSIFKNLLSEVSEDIALLLSLPISAVVANERFCNLSDLEKLQTLLVTLTIGATAMLQSELHAAGEVINGEALTRDKYFNDIIELKLTERGMTKAQTLVSEIL